MKDTAFMKPSLLTKASRRPSPVLPYGLIVLLSAFLLLSKAIAHDHYAAGITDANNNGLPDAGEQFQLVGVTGTDKTYYLMARPVGQRPTQRCGGYYMLDERPRTLHPLDAFTFIALSDGQTDAASTNHAHTGSWVWMEIVSVKGPAGAHFGFWDEDWSASNDTPSVSFPTNQPTNKPGDIYYNKFILTESVDNPLEDPYGHIHGRSWTADKPGDYYIGFKLYDMSHSNPNGTSYDGLPGGPWHAPSQTYIFHFLAGPSFQPTGRLVPNTGYKLTWQSQMGIWNTDPSQTGISFNIQRSTSLAPNSWQTIGAVIGTTNDTASFTDVSPPTGKAFYRLNYLWSPP